MSFKFYTRAENACNLYCKDDNNRLYWFIFPWEEHAYWIQNDEIDFDLIEITEKQAQEICNNRVYAVEVWVPKKKKGVKIYKSLYKVPNFEFRKILLLSIIAAIIVFGLLFLLSLVNGKPENFFYFFFSSCIYVLLSIIVDRIFNLSDGEGFFIVLVIGFLLGALFYN